MSATTNTTTNAPINALTRNEYTGGNRCLLLGTFYPEQEWATYKQWLELGYQVQKGQKGTKLTRMMVIKSKDGGKDKTVPRYYTVFNVEQCKYIEQNID